LKLKSDISSELLSEPFCFTSDAYAEFQTIFGLFFRLGVEQKCFAEISLVLRRKMTELIDKLTDERKFLAAATMMYDRDLIASCQCQSHHPNLQCPILRFIGELHHALEDFKPKTLDKKEQFFYIA